jgi:hypothetical protein
MDQIQKANDSENVLSFYSCRLGPFCIWSGPVSIMGNAYYTEEEEGDIP